MSGVVLGLHASLTGGVPKHPVEMLEVSQTGCAGDQQNDQRHHGGPLRAVCLLEEWVLKRLQHDGHPIFPGSTGENMLISGFSPGDLGIGSQLCVGPVQLLITSAAVPCKTIRDSFIGGHFHHLSDKRNPGQTRWYAEVIQAGIVRLGDEVRLVTTNEPTGNQ